MKYIDIPSPWTPFLFYFLFFIFTINTRLCCVCPVACLHGSMPAICKHTFACSRMDKNAPHWARFAEHNSTMRSEEELLCSDTGRTPARGNAATPSIRYRLLVAVSAAVTGSGSWSQIDELFWERSTNASYKRYFLPAAGQQSTLGCIEWPHKAHRHVATEHVQRPEQLYADV